MSSPPTTPTPAPAPPTAPPGPPPGYPAYPPYPPYAWYPPPRRDNTALIVAIIVILVIGVPIALSAVLYFMVSDLIRGPSGTPPIVLVGPVDLANGNATISINAASRSLSPSQFHIILAANNSASSAVELPPPNGSVSVTTAGYPLRVFWLDNDHDGTVTQSDAFRITGNLAPLPPSTSFEFTLIFIYSGGDGETSIGWRTP